MVQIQQEQDKALAELMPALEEHFSFLSFYFEEHFSTGITVIISTGIPVRGAGEGLEG